MSSGVTVGSGIVVAAVEGAMFGEVTYEETLYARHAYVQGLDVLTQAGQIAADVGNVSTNSLSEVLDVGAKLLPEALNIGTEILT